MRTPRTLTVMSIEFGRAGRVSIGSLICGIGVTVGGDGGSIWRNIVPLPGGDCAHAVDPTTTELTKRTAPKWTQDRRSADWTLCVS